MYTAMGPAAVLQNIWITTDFPVSVCLRSLVVLLVMITEYRRQLCIIVPLNGLL